jgi:putative endonuclease
MYTVYVLYSRTWNKIYIGCTSNLEQRFLSHNSLAKKGWTVQFRPWEIVHTEQYEDKLVALARERELKMGHGREFIWDLIKNGE